jgi:Skp family chaperone for outer membrane proteins
MSARKRKRSRRSPAAKAAAKVAPPKPVATRPAAPEPPSVRTLERKLKQAEAALEALRQRHAKQLEAVRRAADRKLAELVQEIVALRHHEARADMLARLLAERTAAAAPAAEESNHAEAPRPAGG